MPFPDDGSLERVMDAVDREIAMDGVTKWDAFQLLEETIGALYDRVHLLMPDLLAEVQSKVK